MGVLHVLEEQGVKPDIIVGTSIGAIVGGLYAAGLSADELDSLFTAQDWLSLFAREVLMPGTIENRFRELLPSGLPSHFDSLATPFRCVAVDLHTLEQHVFAEGDLAQAMRASMAIPGVLRSVKTDSMKLVDGGMLNNLPTDIVRQMGADVVIAVDLQQHQHPSDEEENSLTLPDTDIPVLDWILQRPDWDNYQRNLKLADILIHPDLKGYGVASFSRRAVVEMIDIGQRTALKQKKKLRRLR